MLNDHGSPVLDRWGMVEYKSGADLCLAGCRQLASAMPLLKRKPYQPSFTAPEGFNLGAEVFVVRFTGELFTSYE